MKELKSVGLRIIIKPDEIIKKTESGIILTESLIEPPNTGTVMSVGNKVSEIKVGDEIMFDPMSINAVKYNDKEYLTLYEQGVIALIK